MALRKSSDGENAMNPKTVIDASVVVKWFTKETGHAQAAALRDAHIHRNTTLAAPDLLVYEIANALRYSPNLEASDVKLAVKSLNMLGVVLYPPSEKMISRAIDLSDKFSTTIYDASYIALAEELDTHLVTADNKLVSKDDTNRVTPLIS
jgi:predicted nucleic acid-binding protein